MRDTVATAALLRRPLEEQASLKEAWGAGNWARHAPPPGVPEMPAATAGAGAFAVRSLEEFRATLYAVGQGAEEEAAGQAAAPAAHEADRTAAKAAMGCFADTAELIQRLQIWSA